jgi:hypothetical protein
VTTETGTLTPHHWALTLNGRTGGRDVTVGSHGVLPLAPGASRYRVCDQLIKELLATFEQGTGVPLNNYAIAHFDLQPDRIN